MRGSKHVPHPVSILFSWVEELGQSPAKGRGRQWDHWLMAHAWGILGMTGVTCSEVGLWGAWE